MFAKKIQRTQSHDGKDIGTKYNERVGGNGKNGRNTVQGKKQVGKLDGQKSAE